MCNQIKLKTTLLSVVVLCPDLEDDDFNSISICLITRSVCEGVVLDRSVSFRYWLRIQEAGAEIRPQAWPPKWPTAPFANTAIRFTLHHLWELALDSRHTRSVIPHTATSAYYSQGTKCRRNHSAQRVLYSFPSRHSAPSQNWQFNDFTSFLWNSQCTVGNDRFEVQQESYIIEGLTGPGWVLSFSSCHCSAGREKPLIQSTGDRISTLRVILNRHIVNHNKQ